MVFSGFSPCLMAILGFILVYVTGSGKGLRSSLLNSVTSTTDMTLLGISWSKYGYNPYVKDQIIHNEPEPVDINGYTGLIYETESDRLIAWTAAENATYHVRGSLDREELIRVARSIP